MQEGSTRKVVCCIDLTDDNKVVEVDSIRSQPFMAPSEATPVSMQPRPQPVMKDVSPITVQETPVEVMEDVEPELPRRRCEPCTIASGVVISFTDMRSLRRHCVICHAPKKFPCRYPGCSEKFTLPILRQEHVRCMHGGRHSRLISNQRFVKGLAEGVYKLGHGNLKWSKTRVRNVATDSDAQQDLTYRQYWRLLESSDELTLQHEAIVRMRPILESYGDTRGLPKLRPMREWTPYRPRVIHGVPTILPMH